jgi:acetyltransferase-like isoleucine patch superfamily enzyme
MTLAAFRPLRGVATRMAMLAVPPFYGRVALAKLTESGFIAPSAAVRHRRLRLGRHCFIGDGVIIYEDRDGGEVTLGDGVHLHQGSIIQTGAGGRLSIGDGTHVQPNCQFSAYRGDIHIGRGVEIAPRCAFYPYNHGMAPETPIRKQPLGSRGGIVVGDDAWMGYGVILLDGARIGRGAVIGAGSVVTGPIPENAIAAGNPARVLRYRGQVAPAPTEADR